MNWQALVSPLLQKTNSYLLFSLWGCQFITRLHNIVHKQWICRNTCIHYRGKDGLSIPEHQEIMNRVEEHAYTDPDTLLPRHRHLLGEDFKVLGSGQTSNRLLWLASMESATAVSTLVKMGTLPPKAVALFNVATPRHP
jgi:hypothetical protein